jgi:hypothetical protein
MKVGDSIQIRPDPNNNIWELAIITEVGEEIKCSYWINRVRHEFSFYFDGHEEDKQVRA